MVDYAEGMESSGQSSWFVGPKLVDTDRGHRAVTFGNRTVGCISEETHTIRDSPDELPQREHVTVVEIPRFGVRVHLRGEHRSAETRELAAKTFARCDELAQRDRDRLGLDDVKPKASGDQPANETNPSGVDEPAV